SSRAAKVFSARRWKEAHMDQLDDLLADFFNPAVAPAGLAARITRARRPAERAVDLARFHIEAGDDGIRRVSYGRGGDVATGTGRRHAARAREELGEYLAGTRTFFSVPVDLRG